MIEITDIYNYFEDYNIKHSNNGFRYLITAVQLGIEDIENCNKITKLYETVAEIHSTTKTNVERSIRYAIARENTTAKEFIMSAIYDLLLMNKEMDIPFKTTIDRKNARV